ncbi:MAG: alpha/beta hydrolase [Propionibacteriaceae bacterium]|jgi:alpha-beta hydrolase superfamily lysophospholipase|nr:alpha/beta hydrolase [Propionibacteriaceae bacterium]
MSPTEVGPAGLAESDATAGPAVPDSTVPTPAESDETNPVPVESDATAAPAETDSVGPDATAASAATESDSTASAWAALAPISRRLSGPIALIGRWRSILRGDIARGDEPAPDQPAAPPEDESGWWSGSWAPDFYLDGYEDLTFHMPARPHLPEEGEGYLTATLVRAGPDRQPRAVLYIHGWNEYFFQDHLARAWTELGYDFYALDLHRYGRSLHGDELPGYAESVTDYFEEIDAAIALISVNHRFVVLNGHSNGGLISALWTSARPGKLVGLVLNAPWLALGGSPISRALTQAAGKALSGRVATWEIPLAEDDSYIRSLHRDLAGEWSFDLALKRLASIPVRPGWVKAVIRAQDRVKEGLDIDVPVLVVMSARSATPKQRDDPAITTTDIVLDVDQVARRAPQLGWHVTLVRLEGALHDVALSALPVRQRYFDEIRRWDLAYIRGRQTQQAALAAADDSQTAPPPAAAPTD